MTSTRASELGADAEASNEPSVFTETIAHGLLGAVDDHDHDGFVKLEDLYSYLHQQLSKSKMAIPQKNFSGTGDVPIARRDRLVPPSDSDSDSDPDPAPPPRPPPRAKPDLPTTPTTTTPTEIDSRRRWLWPVVAVVLLAIVGLTYLLCPAQ